MRRDLCLCLDPDMSRTMVNRVRTRLAKAVFFVGGCLTRVHTYQRFYTLDWEQPGHAWEFTECKREWASWDFAFTMLRWSEDLDPAHWEHWALDHTECDAVKCAGCGGLLCLGDFDALNELEGGDPYDCC